MGITLLLLDEKQPIFFFDTSLPAITEFTASLRGAVGVDFSCIDSNEGIKKKRTCLNWRCQKIHRQLKRADTRSWIYLQSSDCQGPATKWMVFYLALDAAGS